MREAMPATVERLTLRVAACQLLGTAIGLTIATIVGSIWRPQTAPMLGSRIADLAVVAVSSLFVGLPFFAIATLLAVAFRRSILDHPMLWCVGVPVVLLAAAFVAFPPNQFGGIFWIALIPLCALVSGLIFLGWLKLRPLYAEPLNAN